MTTNSHHTVREAIKKRIECGEWQLGDLIPGEITLAAEYGCARTTINRALQALANDGLVIRKRKGGTRVCSMPVRKAQFSIPILREQVEAIGSNYKHQVIHSELKIPPSSIRTRLSIAKGEKALFVETIHVADDQPYAYEERWVNIQTVPAILELALDEISINEWLVKTVPFSSGDVAFSAFSANEQVAQALDTQVGNALFLLDRTTWMGEEFVTAMKLYYRDGYRLYSEL